MFLVRVCSSRLRARVRSGSVLDPSRAQSQRLMRSQLVGRELVADWSRSFIRSLMSSVIGRLATATTIQRLATGMMMIRDSLVARLAWLLATKRALGPLVVVVVDPSQGRQEIKTCEQCSLLVSVLLAAASAFLVHATRSSVIGSAVIGFGGGGGGGGGVRVASGSLVVVVVVCRPDQAVGRSAGRLLR